MTGGSRIVDLARGLYRLNIAGLPSVDTAPTEIADPAIHLCILPGENGGDALLSSEGTSGRDIWLGSEGGVVFAASHGGTSRVLVTAYERPDGNAEAPQVTTQRIADAPA